jgi:hypothetical protein
MLQGSSKGDRPWSSEYNTILPVNQLVQSDQQMASLPGGEHRNLIHCSVGQRQIPVDDTSSRISTNLHEAEYRKV